MNRSAIRELAFRLIYSQEIQKEENIEEQIELFLEANEVQDKNAIEYINDILKGIKENNAEILSLIEKNLKTDWKLERISKINLALLKLAIYEMLYKKVPYKVVINEAVELAKKYGEDASSSFINGVLATVVKKNSLEEKSAE